MEDAERTQLKSIIKEAIREVLEEEGVILPKQQEYALLDQSLSSLGLSTKILRAFSYRQIYTIRQLVQLTIFDVKDLRNVGEKGVTEILGKLKENNLKLRM
jgi:DNA-directed RNA polymerase subunit alpha